MHIISQCMKSLCENPMVMTLIYSLWKYFTPSKTPYILKLESTTSHFFREIDTEWHVTEEVLLHTVTQIKSIRRKFFDFYSPFWVYIKSKNMDHKLSALRSRFHEKFWMEVIDLNFKRCTFWNQYGSLCS